jgi:16S rRNA (adenine1518-N6/adenine1519-N6)-dimethyltransferase
MIQHRESIPFMAGMFQFEMARRIASAPNSKEYGIISVITQAFYEVKLEFNIEPGAFFPPPKVRSAVISCTRMDGQTLDCDEKLFIEVVKASFSQRRKMLGNSISRFNIPKDVFQQNEFAKLRAENLTVADFVSLTNFIEKHRK